MAPSAGRGYRSWAALETSGYPHFTDLLILGLPLLMLVVWSSRLLPLAYQSAKKARMLERALDGAPPRGRVLVSGVVEDDDDPSPAFLFEVRMAPRRSRGRKGRVWVEWTECERRFAGRRFIVRTDQGQRVRVHADGPLVFPELPPVETPGEYSHDPRVRAVCIREGARVFVHGTWEESGGPIYRRADASADAQLVAKDGPLVLWTKDPIEPARAHAYQALGRLCAAFVIVTSTPFLVATMRSHQYLASGLLLLFAWLVQSCPSEPDTTRPLSERGKEYRGEWARRGGRWSR